MEKDDLARAIKNSRIIALIFILGIPISYGIWFGMINEQPISLDSSNWGTFGDFVGGILNPIVALFAFYWLTISVLIQKTELSATQAILTETVTSQQDQALTQENKRFEDSFYSLLEQMNGVFASLNTKDKDNTRSQIESLYRRVFVTGINRTTEERVANMRECSVDCSHYFRIIYQMLKFILLNCSSDKNQTFDIAMQKDLNSREKLYSNIVRSFLNKKVTQLLAMNCIDIDDGLDFSRFKKLVERYALLEHITFDGDSVEALIGFYDPKAFGTNPYLQAGNLSS